MGPAFRRWRLAFRGEGPTPESASGRIRRAPLALNLEHPPFGVGGSLFGADRPLRIRGHASRTGATLSPGRPRAVRCWRSEIRRRSIGAAPVSTGSVSELFDKRRTSGAGERPAGSGGIVSARTGAGDCGDFGESCPFHPVLTRGASYRMLSIKMLEISHLDHDGKDSGSLRL